LKAPLKLSLVAGLAILIASAAPTLAQAPDGTPGPDSHPGGGPNQTAANHTANATEARERHATLVAARQAALDSFHENRTRILREYNASLHAIRASFLENKTRVLDDCAAKRNETQGNATSKCVQDGLKPLIEKARTDLQAAREATLKALTDLRASALGGFQSAKAAADAKYGKPSG
jgi:hypothetical protein